MLLLEVSVPSRNNGDPIIFLYNKAGNNKVKGTEVEAPISATKSEKNGTELAIK
jgi:hypothetical protein